MEKRTNYEEGLKNIKIQPSIEDKKRPLSPFQRTQEELQEELNISLDQMEKGEVLSHEEVMTMLDEMIKKYE